MADCLHIIARVVVYGALAAHALLFAADLWLAYLDRRPPAAPPGPGGA